MSGLADFIGQWVNVELSGNKCFNGIIADTGSDIIVLKEYALFYYIPLIHIQRLTLLTHCADGEGVTHAGESSVQSIQAEDLGTFPIEHAENGISFRKILTQAKGHFLELYTSGNTTLHGYLTSIMSDYFVFHSPVYNTVYIALQHVKWLVPYPQDATPYSLPTDAISFHPVSIPVLRSFQDQCKKFEGNLVVFDCGDNPNKTGLLRHVDTTQHMVELVTANGQVFHWNLHHLKCVYTP